MSTPQPPDLSTVVKTLNAAGGLLAQRVQVGQQVSDALLRLATVLEPLEDLLAQLAAIDAQIKAANIDATVAALKAFQAQLPGGQS